MQSVEPLRQTDPEMAEWVSSWQQTFERSYDFSKDDEKAAFEEALQTMGKFIASSNKDSTVSLNLSSDGVTALITQTSPKSKE